VPGKYSQRGNKIGYKINILNKTFDFLVSTNFKLLSQIKENSINHCDIIKFIIYVRGCYCCGSSHVPKHLTLPLLANVPYD
jgi:hypothetical protein